MSNRYSRIVDFVIVIDNRFGTSFQKHGGEIYRIFLKKWSLFKRITDPVLVKLRYKLGITPPGELKLHLGCGPKHFAGYINIDLWITSATDMICDITKLPWPDNSVSLIESYHVIEHISHRKIRDALAEWYRVLKPGYKLIVECPHFDETIKEYLAGNEKRLINVFGWQRAQGDIHLYGYNPQRLTRLLCKIGFSDCFESIPKSSQVKDEPCFRIECIKPVS